MVSILEVKASCRFIVTITVECHLETAALSTFMEAIGVSWWHCQRRIGRSMSLTAIQHTLNRMLSMIHSHMLNEAMQFQLSDH